MNIVCCASSPTRGWRVGAKPSAMPPRQPRWPSRRPAITPAWRVSAARAVPIAAGENAAGLHDFHAQFEAGSIDVAQPSVIKIGVPSAMLEIAALAKTFGVRVVPHNAYFGPGFLASLHVNATIAPDAPFERLFIDLEASPPHDLVVAKDGGVTVPDGPVLGRDPDMVVLRRYLVGGRTLHRA
jgi:D-galactarolactone cycloisomerase